VDIASGCCNSPVLVFLGRGDGTFQRPVVSAMLASSLWVADLNGDGLPDLITQSWTAGSALGKGDGTFEPLVPFAMPGAASGVDPPSYDPFAVDDFTGDGTADVAMRLPNGVAICPGTGDGTFGPPVKHTVGGIYYSAASADLDGDGRPDVATLN